MCDIFKRWICSAVLSASHKPNQRDDDDDVVAAATCLYCWCGVCVLWEKRRRKRANGTYCECVYDDKHNGAHTDTTYRQHSYTETGSTVHCGVVDRRAASYTRFVLVLCTHTAIVCVVN